MRGIRHLIHEIHRRSLWQVLGIYIGTAWFVLEVADHLVNKLGLPQWVYGLGFLVMLFGLPIVLATAFVQEGIPRSDETPEGAPGPRPGGAGGDGTLRRLFTWRHAILGGLVACAAWGLLAFGWLVLLDRDPGALPWPVSNLASRSVSGGSAGAAEPSRPSVAQSSDTAPALGAAAGPARDSLRLSAEPESVGVASEGARDTAGAGVQPGYEAYLSTRERAEAARIAAVEVGADSLAAPVFGAAEALRTLGLEAAEAGRYAEAERVLGRALPSYREARDAAVDAWTAALGAEGVEVAAARSGADSTRQEYVRAREAERRSADLASGGHFREALAVLSAAGDLYRSVPRPTAPETEAPARGKTAAPASEESTTVPAEVVRTLLGRLSAALAAEDLATVKRIWASLGAEESANLERFFRDRRDIRVTYNVEEGSLTATDDRISFAVRTTWDYFDETTGRSVQQPPFEQRFDAVRLDGVWTLVSR